MILGFDVCMNYDSSRGRHERPSHILPVIDVMVDGTRFTGWFSHGRYFSLDHWSYEKKWTATYPNGL